MLPSNIKRYLLNPVQGAMSATSAHVPIKRRNGYIAHSIDNECGAKRVRIEMAPHVRACLGAGLYSGGGDSADEAAAAAGNSDIPDTVLQYERQMRKMKAADRAGAPVTREKHLKAIYEDDHLVVVDKPSGVLCVPGVNRNPSLLTVVYETYGCESDVMDNMIVHRLDMDTSGLVVFARTRAALR